MIAHLSLRRAQVAPAAPLAGVAPARRAAAPVCVLVLAMTFTLFKGPVLDLDPLNVCFWLLAGMLLSYLQIARTSHGPSHGPACAHSEAST